MTSSRAILLAVATFVVGFGLCVALFAALDVEAIYLVGPAIAVGAGAYAAYHTATNEHRG